MTVREVLLLGNPQLYQISEEVNQQEIESLKPAIADLHDTMIAFRQKWGGGRAIAPTSFALRSQQEFTTYDRSSLNHI